MTLSEQASVFALERHGGQMYGEVPYGFHLAAVVDTLVRFGVTSLHEDWLLASAWLHDVLEDTDTTYDEINDRFGAQVAGTVYAVTAQEGKNRKERNRRTYEVTKEFQHAITLKLADRIANVESSKANAPGLFAMYKKEHEEFKRALYHPDNDLIALRMWKRLDTLFEE